MKNSSKKRQTFVLLCTFLLGLGLGHWLTTKAAIVHHGLKCQHTVYLGANTRYRPQTLKEEVETNSRLLLVAVLVNTKKDPKSRDTIYNDFSTEANIKFLFFATKSNISLKSTLVVLEGLDASTEPKVKYLRMLIHVSQQYGNKFNWFLFTESNYFVNVDKLTFLKKLQYSKEFVFLPQVPRKSGVNDHGHELNRPELLDSLAQRVEYQKSNIDIVHVIQPGMILSRPLLQKISSLTESCMNQGRVLPQCLQKSFSISWIHDFEVAIVLT